MSHWEPIRWNAKTLFKFVFAVIGIYSSFILWGIMQEKIAAEGYVNPDDPDGPKAKFKAVAVLNLVQATCACTVGLLASLATGASLTATPPTAFFLVSVTTTIASPFGYYALNFVPYPLFALGKACKLVPVMLMSIFVNKQKFTITEYSAVGLISLGVALYSLKTDVEMQSHLYTLIGLAFIFVNLFLDGWTNAAQDKMHAHAKSPIPASVFMCLLNAWAVLLLLSFVGGEHVLVTDSASSLTYAIEFVAKYPQVLQDMLLFSLCGSIGQLFIFFSIRELGSLTNTTICITRKLVTIVLSVIRFNHPMTSLKWSGVAMVFAGLGLKVWTKYNKQRAQHAQAADGGKTKKE